MQFNKEGPSKLIKKSGLRKISTLKNKQQKNGPNPVTSSRITTYLSEKSIKARSSSKCMHCGSFSTNQLLQKFKQLQKKYVETLQIVKQKNKVYESQKKELQRLRATHEHDKIEINQLRTMLGFMKRKDIGTQTNQQQKSTYEIAKEGNLEQKFFNKNAADRVVNTPKRARNQIQSESQAFFSHNYSNQSTKTLPQRTRISKKKVAENQQEKKEERKQDGYTNSILKKSRKNPQESFIRNSEGSLSKQYQKRPASPFLSPYSKLRYKMNTDLMKK